MTEPLTPLSSIPSALLAANATLTRFLMAVWAAPVQVLASRPPCSCPH